MKCPKCGSERIETGITWGYAMSTGTSIGLKYKDTQWGSRKANVFSDLCLDCGTIVSTYIKDTTDKEWIKNY